MPDVQLRTDGSIHYDDVDLADPWAPAETVLLHHGLGKTGAHWRAWVRVLARDFRVLTVDMLGNGGSSQPVGREWSIAGYARDAVEVLDAIGLERVHFVGEGLGGCVGLHLAATEPARVATLTLCATPYRPAAEGGSANLEANSREIAEHGLADFVERTLPDRMEWSRFPAGMYEWFRRARLSTSPRIMSEQMLAQHHVDLEWTLRRIAAPTLLIIPGASPSKADAQMDEMINAITDTTVLRFPDERQWVTFARAEECATALARFVAARRG